MFFVPRSSSPIPPMVHFRFSRANIVQLHGMENASPHIVCCVKCEWAMGMGHCQLKRAVAARSSYWPIY